jgi:YHS domain-containing protein
MRGLLILLCLVLIYYAVRTIVRSALGAYRQEGTGARRLKGEEMVLDPQCHTYIVKERAVTRRIQGSPRYFCSEACAQRYEEGHHG